jgi:hypothetical protein
MLKAFLSTEWHGTHEQPIGRAGMKLIKTLNYMDVSHKLHGSEALTKKEGVSSRLCSFFFSFSCDEMRLSPLGTSATIWPTVPAPDDE